MSYLKPHVTSPEYASDPFPYERYGEIEAAPFRTDVFTHAFLDKLYGQCRDLNELAGPAKSRLFESEYNGLSEAVEQTAGVVVPLGLGYPFYAHAPDKEDPREILVVPEISRYITEQASLISRDRLINLGAWACAVCQQERALPDLKSQCKPCDLTDLKPREPFKVLPDLDMWVIVEESSDSVKQAISDNLAAEGYHPSDEDIARSIRATDAVLKKVLRYNGKISLPSKTHLPVDVHVIQIDDFKDAMHQFIRDPAAESAIFPESLRVGWHKELEPTDFAFDFVFSLTELGNLHNPHPLRAGFIAELQHTRQLFARWLDASGQDISTYLSRRSERGRRILQSPELREVASARINSWREAS